MKKQQRPVFLNPLKIQLPAGALASILHRVSGLLLFAAIPIVLVLLQRSLSSADEFDRLADTAGSGLASRLFLALLLAALVYHFCAGIRVLLLDMDIGLTLPQARNSARFVLAAGAMALLLLGVWLW